jgi:hypothetical protein
MLHGKVKISKYLVAIPPLIRTIEKMSALLLWCVATIVANSYDKDVTYIHFNIKNNGTQNKEVLTAAG